MQEEVENRTLTLVVSGTKFTGRMFKAAISKYMAHRKEKKLQKQRSRDAPVIPHGKQTVKQLVGQNQGISNIEITDPSIKEFEKIARKYGVDYAVKKDRSSSQPKYLIFFKSRDADALTAAFTEYTNKKRSRRPRKRNARLLKPIWLGNGECDRRRASLRKRDASVAGRYSRSVCSASGLCNTRRGSNHAVEKGRAYRVRLRMGRANLHGRHPAR